MGRLQVDTGHPEIWAKTLLLLLLRRFMNGEKKENGITETDFFFFFLNTFFSTALHYTLTSNVDLNGDYGFNMNFASYSFSHNPCQSLSDISWCKTCGCFVWIEAQKNHIKISSWSSISKPNWKLLNKYIIVFTMYKFMLFFLVLFIDSLLTYVWLYKIMKIFTVIYFLKNVHKINVKHDFTENDSENNFIY